ncbi:MAG: IS66 family transposase [Candidatus Thiodiazotropha sp. (ex Epidulcina cf. delphinae)]|nr:IS66 family transposase [Candidatus Thiodiazotropha sp. (ex Epidulcina cf. delphinae)]
MRRKFVEATHGRKHTAAGHQIMALIRKRYQVERGTKDKTPQARQVIHQEQTGPLLDKIKSCSIRKWYRCYPRVCSV